MASKQTEHGVSLENMGNMENMEKIDIRRTSLLFVGVNIKIYIVFLFIKAKRTVFFLQTLFLRHHLGNLSKTT